jgi:alkylation response protein AidB-like acyl-CoA dehydrogenase
MAIKTRASLDASGEHYVLSGGKQWISNAGFADILIVFAKIDDSKFTAFIVESTWTGVSLGQEEKKMGIKGSSTRSVYFDEVRVPVANVLGEIGRGHKIAFNILNVGRLKLGASTMAGARQALRQGAARLWQGHRGVWPDPAKARRDRGRHLCRREPGLPYRAPHGGIGAGAGAESRGGTGSFCRGGIHCQGLWQ